MGKNICFTIGNTFENKARNNHAERGQNLQQQLVPGRHRAKIIKNPGNQHYDQRGEAWQKAYARINGSKEKTDRRGGKDKNRGKTYAAKPGNISLVNFSFVNMIIPGFFMRQPENQRNTRKGKNE
jgi:hypothetical protein